MFIQVTTTNGDQKPATIGLRYIVRIEPYDQPSEPEIKAIITMPDLVLNIAETYDELLRRVWDAYKQ